ncbi:bifunctional hydroxymethylpyrimidine kinase/phosphomethylpyrimidine kinase [Halobaculum gomorrense]|uniref:Hydroxymethylpyrimidine/phosphomethylpyrimidine kinase n=1 Tax=Halobaculum gomorrense TaxID=43928 RepID=A0A1M5PH95_9EURY|nr:bifunctional hydroxymethylpyrimidine kinase/phosphomethylpyrimidine kinase [Halobaculum gomorrense]SHH01194.1 hydroxymethylpyrimidine/phosphomethylpyrimidine kinase [Halobaculum gomorrense]
MTGVDPVSREVPYALAIASSDSSGGAGVQADLKTMARLGVYGGSVVVATTAQNTTGVRSTHLLPTDEVRAQYDAVVDDVAVGAVKTGMLATVEGVRTVHDCLRSFDGPVVVDPVMVATSGDRLLEAEAVDAYRDLFAEATLVTPNADETAELVGERPSSSAARERAADRFFDWGADAVLFKGGHVNDDSATVTDVLISDGEGGPTAVDAERIATDATHGSGCTLSSAVAAELARGASLSAAVERGIEFVRAGLREPARVGEHGSVNHLAWSEPRE